MIYINELKHKYSPNYFLFRKESVLSVAVLDNCRMHLTNLANCKCICHIKITFLLTNTGVCLLYRWYAKLHTTFLANNQSSVRLHIAISLSDMYCLVNASLVNVPLPMQDLKGTVERSHYAFLADTGVPT